MITLVAALALAGCTRKPMIEPTFPGFQPEISSTQQWRKLAAETASQLMATLANVPDPAMGHIVDQSGAPRTLARRPIFIAWGGEQAFLRGFREFVTAELVAQGYFVTPEPLPGAVIVNTSTQIVAFDATPRYRPGELSAAVGLGYLGRQSLKWGTATTLAAAIPVALAADAYFYLTDTPNAELLVTTAVVDETRYLFQKTTIYYVELGDAVLYDMARIPPAPIPTQTGAVGSRQTVTVRLPLTSQ